MLFLFDVDATPRSVLEAVMTGHGIKGFLTTVAEVPTGVGETLQLGFAAAPAPFDLRIEESDERVVNWRTETFPPHWVGTSIRWEIDARDGGTVVGFRHVGFAGDVGAGHTACTGGQIMVQLTRYTETGVRDPVFS